MEGRRKIERHWQYWKKGEGGKREGSRKQ